MAVIFVDGFDHYASGDVVYKYASGTMGTVSGRFGGQACRRLTGTGSDIVSKTIWGVAPTTVIVGFAFRTTSFAFGSANRMIDIGTLQVGCTSGGIVDVRRSGTVLVSAPTSLTVDTWTHIEVKALMSASVGTVSLRFNGVEVASGSSLNTGTAATTFTLQHMTGGAGQATFDIDDLRISDATGGAPWNDVLGDTKVETLYPTGAGTTTQWAPSAGSNYQNVDDATAVDEDSTYNSETTIGDKDTFAMGDLSTSGGTIYAVQAFSVARKTDAGARQVANVLRHSSTDYDQATATLGSGYDGVRDVLMQDPTSANWTVSSVNALEAGYKLIA